MRAKIKSVRKINEIFLRTFTLYLIFMKNVFGGILKAKYQNVIYIRKGIKRFWAIQCNLETVVSLYFYSLIKDHPVY